MKLAPKRIADFQKLIFGWWKTHRRDLPWRHTYDPYRILVSEVMLQQTQVARVLPKYTTFIQEFPTVQALASASLASVIRAWKGMGYNRRALFLRQAAQVIVNTHKGQFPVNEEELQKLPGLGIYTARALLVFAFRKEVGLVDTNIRQIIVHYFFKGTPQKPAIIQEVADQLVPKGKSWEWHQALMDYGALELTKKRIQKFSIPFKETNRFYRGRIIDFLREKPMEEHSMIDSIFHSYAKSKDGVKIIIQDLVDDGLIQRVGNVLKLSDG